MILSGAMNHLLKFSLFKSKFLGDIFQVSIKLNRLIKWLIELLQTFFSADFSISNEEERWALRLSIPNLVGR